MSVRFHLFVFDVNQENKYFVCKKVGSRFSCVAPGMERFSLDFPRGALENGDQQMLLVVISFVLRKIETNETGY